ncbi:trypsin inhibitor ClTI-1-like isoform X1 [Rhincodon typus]|uniref:trypsin inhibitor ClTI-1-like isoform X1 n=1 Tax=Rhincodon typus TaxID=259920 RepID=UPI00202E17C9|nr:trypsin inhibitor ClTI-1-like isoform X1 [Rhincodon typus]
MSIAMRILSLSVVQTDGITEMLASFVNTIDQLGAAIELKCDDYPKLPDCPSRYVPLCGTNGKDYLNPCYLCRHNKKTREDVAILHEGFCTCQDMKIN